MHQFYVFNTFVMRIFRVVLRCRNVTNTSLMRLFFNTFCNVSVTRRLWRKIATMHPFYVFNMSWNVPVSCRLTSKIRPKFARFAHKRMSFTFRTCPIMCVLSHKKFKETSLRNVHNVLVFVFNTSCNVTLSCCFTSQYLLNTLVSFTSEIRAFRLAMHQFYVFNKSVMRIFRVDLRCKNVTNTSLVRLSSTRPVM